MIHPLPWMVFPALLAACSLRCSAALVWPIEKMKRITIPLTVSVLLLLVYGALQLFEPELLGPHFRKYVPAVLLLGLSVGLVRAISFVLFDVVFQKRKGREAPALLRVLLSIILYSVSLALI